MKQDLAYEDKKTWYRFYRMPGSTVWMTKEFGVSPLSSSDYTDEYGSLDWERYSAADDAYRQAIKEEDYAQGRNVVSEPEALDLLSLLQNATVDEQRRRLVKMARRDYERMFTPTGQGVAAHIKGVLHWLWRS
ncbi:MAG TPA: hypothetical protein VKT82_21630 [Ktedonobacterales bacterium]|nr:hypothetical protein [Ktedonobacterales bacterium]